MNVGQRVLALPAYGAYAEKLKTEAVFCFPLPDDIPYEAAVALGLVSQTSWFALKDRAGLGPGETVLVLGASGGVGLASAQLAKALGAGNVIGVTRGAESVRWIGEHGCDVAIDASMDDLRNGLREAVFEATDGKGADIVIDPVGGAVHEAALRAMAWRGRMVIVGFAGGDIPSIRANYLLVKNISVAGLQWTDYRARRPAEVAEAQAEIFRLWRDGQLSPPISRVLPLESFAEALAALGAGTSRGRLLLKTGFHGR